MSSQTRTNLYGLFIAILLLALCIAYAQVLNQTLEVKGEAEAKAQTGVFITDVEYYANSGADTENCEVINFTGTMLNSKVTLGASSGSTYTYKVTLHNNTDKEYVFIGVMTNKASATQYSNTNIDYSVESVNGLAGLEEYVTTIAPGEYITFPVTFKYTGSNVSNRVLTSYLNFRFREKPVLDLSNNGQTYTLENITAGHEQEYEFTVSNYNKNYTNGVPMTYSFETTLTEGSPLEAKIYDENGAEVTGNISELGDGIPVDRTYTLKLTWDENKNGAEYRGEEYTCNVKLKAVANDTDYGEYKIEKEFQVDITTEANTPPTVTVEANEITSTTAKITAIGEDEDGNTLTYTLEINGQTYTSDTGIFEVTGLGAGKTYTYTVSVTDGYETVTVEKTLTTECINYIVEYIESTGTQYIDTGIIPNQDTKVVLRAKYPVTSSSSFLFGASAGSVNKAFSFSSNASKYRLIYNNSEIYCSTTPNDTLDIIVDKNVVTINENIVANGVYAVFTPSVSMYIFAENRNGEAYKITTATLYYLKIYQGDALVRDFVPSLDDNNVACLYDKVTKQYFYNSGTGTFNYEMKQVGHIWGDWEITKLGTCIEEGIETRTCTICGDKQIQSIAVTGHNYVSGTCSKCGAECNHNYSKPSQAGTMFLTTGTYSDGTNTAKIPAGFTVSGAGGKCTFCGELLPTTENIINEGLVIYLIQDKTDAQIADINWNDATTLANLKKTYDQFVWIPMPKANINDMYMCQSETGSKTCKIGLNSSGKAYCSTHSSTKMAGRLYVTDVGETYTPTINNQTYKANEGLREPAVVTGNTSGTGKSYDGNSGNQTQIGNIVGTSFSGTSALLTYLQNEYNEVVKSVYTNEGFYIGRYETSGMVNSDTNVSVKIVAGSDNTTNKNVSNVSWYRMYAQQKKYAENKGLTGSIGSTMIQGAAYDQVMKFIDPTTSFVKTTGRVSHSFSNLYQTGGLNYAGSITYNDVAKNIYDLEGNVRTFTTEARSADYRVTRGGCFYYSSSPSFRNYDIPSSDEAIHGSVCQLYIK